MFCFIYEVIFVFRFIVITKYIHNIRVDYFMKEAFKYTFRTYRAESENFDNVCGVLVFVHTVGRREL